MGIYPFNFKMRSVAAPRAKRAVPYSVEFRIFIGKRYITPCEFSAGVYFYIIIHLSGCFSDKFSLVLSAVLGSFLNLPTMGRTRIDLNILDFSLCDFNS